MSEYITDFEALRGLIGKPVEVSFVYYKSPIGYYTIHEAIATGLAQPREATIRYRGRLGITYSGMDMESCYELNDPEAYENGVLVHDRYTDFIWIQDSDQLRASLLIVLSE